MLSGFVVLSSTKSWQKTVSTQTVRKPIKKKEPPILYSIFQLMAQTTDDVYWSVILVAMAKGKFPKNVTYTESTLHYKSVTLEISSGVDIVKNTSLVLDFIRTNLNLMSRRDIEDHTCMILNEFAASCPPPPNTWSKIKNHSRRMALISKFIDKLQVEPGKREALESLIMVELTADHINDSTIVIKDGEIETILNLTENDGVFSVNPVGKTKRRTVKKMEVDDSLSLDTSDEPSRRNFLTVLLKAMRATVK